MSTGNESLSRPIRRDPRVAWRAFGHEIALIAPPSSTVHTLTDVGARFWELADGRTLEQILEVLLGEFEVTREVLEPDLIELVEELDKRHLVEASEP